MIFDNADEIGMWMGIIASGNGKQRLYDYLPRSSRGSIIFTTRDRKTAVQLAQQNLIQVPEMDEDTAKQLLINSLIQGSVDTVVEMHDMGELLEHLIYLPLAISQASAYINENNIKIGNYLSLLAKQDNQTMALLSEDFQDDSRYSNIKNPVATTWLISFEKILERDSLAANFLSFMACIETTDIPESLLPTPEGTSRKQ
jgi:hypothetical protein